MMEIPRPSIRQIQEATCEYFEVKMIDLLSARRSADMVEARHIAMYLARTMTGFSITMIGGRFDRDHTSVIASYRKVERLIAAKDSATIEAVADLRAKLEGKAS